MFFFLMCVWLHVSLGWCVVVCLGFLGFVWFLVCVWVSRMSWVSWCVSWVSWVSRVVGVCGMCRVCVWLCFRVSCVCLCVLGFGVSGLCVRVFGCVSYGFVNAVSVWIWVSAFLVCVCVCLVVCLRVL